MYAVLALPIPTISHAGPARRIGVFGLVAGGITIAYQVSILGGGLPCRAFTNHYHRGLGLHIDRSVVAGDQHQVAGWATVIRVDNVENGRHTQKWVGTMRVGIEKKILKSSGRSASIFTPMVVKLVGQ
jgi:hypothetical protein